MRIVPALPAVPKKGQGLCFSASVTASLGPAFTAVGQAAGLRAGRGETASEGPVGRAATGDGPISDPAGSAASKSSSAARHHPGTMPTGTRALGKISKQAVNLVKWETRLKQANTVFEWRQITYRSLRNNAPAATR